MNQGKSRRFRLVKGSRKWVALLLAFLLLLDPFARVAVGAESGGPGFASDDRERHQQVLDTLHGSIPTGADQVLYFGLVEEVLDEGYLVSTIPIEVSQGRNVFGHQQAEESLRVLVRNYTDVVTVDDSSELSTGTPVVVAGFEHSGIVEALVIGDMYAAEMVETEVQPPSLEAFEAQEIEEQVEDGMTQSVEELELLQNPGLLRNPNRWEPIRNSRLTSSYGQVDHAAKNRKTFPAIRVGILEIDLYFEYFAGAAMNWDFPFEIETVLHNPIPIFTDSDLDFLPGESPADRNDRLTRSKALLTFDVIPRRHEENRTLFAEAGVRLTVGFKGKAMGIDFDLEIDLVRTAMSPLGIGDIGLNVQAGGKHAAPTFGNRTAFGVRENLTLDEDIIDCGVTGCTINFLTEDAVGIALPFFETGILTFSMEITPAVVISGDYVRLTNFETTGGLVVEQFGQSLDRRVALPLPPGAEVYANTDLALHISEWDPSYTGELSEGVTLSFEYEYHPTAMFGLVYQASIKAKKLGIGGEIKLPFMALEIPYNIPLQSQGGGKLSCTVTELEIEDCTVDAFHFGPEAISMPLGMQGSLPPALSGVPYQSGEIKGTGGQGGIHIQPTGVLPAGLSWQQTGTDQDGNGIYRLVGSPEVKEGIYTLRFRITDREGGNRDVTRELRVGKVYPERIDEEVVIGQYWRTQFKLIEPDGSESNDVSWVLEGDLPPGAYTFGSDGTFAVNGGQLLPGTYTFQVVPTWRGQRYEVEHHHHMRAVQREIDVQRDWQQESMQFLRNYAVAEWHEGLGRVALIAPQQGVLTLRDGRLQKHRDLPLPYFVSMAYVHPEDGRESGWMYLFGGRGGALHDREAAYKGNLYRWDREGIRLLYEDQGDGSSPDVFDALTAALPDGRLVVHGGAKERGDIVSASTWIYDPEENQFERIHSEHGPGVRYGTSAMTYVPELGKVVLAGGRYWAENMDGRLWLFDPQTKQWSTAGAGYTIDLNGEHVETQVVYARGEQAIYILVTARGQEDLPSRLYSINVSTGTLGPMIMEPLPEGSEGWQPDGGVLAYDELNGKLLYLNGTDQWTMGLPSAHGDRSRLITDGLDTVTFQFPLGMYVINPNDWWVEWRSVGNISLFGTETYQRTPVQEGMAEISVSYSDHELVEERVARLRVDAVHRTTGERVAVGYAGIMLQPVPPDPAQSIIQLTPHQKTYMADYFDQSLFGQIAHAELAIVLRSSEGIPLPGRSLTLDNAQELDRHRIFAYTGEIEAGAEYNDLDPSLELLLDPRIGDADGWPYQTRVITDDEGRVSVKMVTLWPGPDEPGEYPIVMRVLDGSDVRLQEVLEFRYRTLQAEQHRYTYDGYVGDAVHFGIRLQGLNRWSGCRQDEPYTCFAVVDGELPPGVSLNGRGIISGKPERTGNYKARIRLPYDTVPSVEVHFELYEPLTLEEGYHSSFYTVAVGEYFSQSVNARTRGGFHPFSYEVDGTLPPGLELDEETGYLRGSFTNPGQYYFQVTIRDQGDRDWQQVRKNYTFNVQEQVKLGSQMHQYGNLSVDQHMDFIVSQLEGLPIGSTEGVFEPYHDSSFYHLEKNRAVDMRPFQLRYRLGSDDSGQTRMYYWHAQEEEWRPFANQVEETDDSGYTYTLVVTVDTEEEMFGIWRQGDSLSRGNFYFDDLYIGLGREAIDPPVVHSVRIMEEHELPLFSRRLIDDGDALMIEIIGENLSPNDFYYPDVFVGGREAFFGDIVFGQLNTLRVLIPPGEGTQNVRVKTYAGISEVHEGTALTFPPDHRVAKDDLRLLVTLSQPEQMYDDDLLVVGERIQVLVELVDLEGNRVRPDDVREGFDRYIVLRNWGVSMRGTTDNYFDVLCPEDGTECEESAVGYHGISGIRGWMKDEGYFIAYLVKHWKEPIDEGHPDASPYDDHMGIDLVVTVPEEGYYNRVAVVTTPEKVADYRDLPALEFRTDLLDEVVIGEPYMMQLEGQGGQGPESYRWRWSGDSLLPPGIVLEEDTGLLRNWRPEDAGGTWQDVLDGTIAAPRMQPGTYIIELILTDGYATVSRKFALQITGIPELNIELEDLEVWVREQPYLLDFEPDRTAYEVRLDDDNDQITLFPVLGQFTVTESVYGPGMSVTGDVYDSVTKNVYMRVNNTTFALGEDGFFSLSLEPGWTAVDMIALVDDGHGRVLATKTYSLLVYRPPSAALERVIVHAEGERSRTVEINFESGRSNYQVGVPPGTDQIRILAETVEAVTNLRVNGAQLDRGRISGPIIMSGETQEIEIQSLIQTNDGEISRTYTLNVRQEASANDDLALLEIEPGSWQEAFDPARTEYTVHVSHTAEQVALNAIAADPNATIRVVADGQSIVEQDGDYLLQPHVGLTTIQVIVRAENGQEKTYRIHLHRAPSNNALLESLSVTSARWEATFDAQRFNYRIAVPEEVQTVDMTAKARESGATIHVTVDGREWSGVNGRYTIPLTLGPDLVTLQVTAPDGKTKQTYTVVIERDAVPVADARLARLEVRDGSGNPATVVAVQERHYRAYVGRQAETIRVIAHPVDPQAVITLEGQPYHAGEESEPIRLSGDELSVELVVTAADGVTALTYTLDVIKRDVREELPDTRDENRHLIGMNGGTVSFEGGKLIIPQNAMSRSFYLTVETIPQSFLPRGHESLSTIVRFTPDREVIFTRELTLELDLDAGVLAQLQADAQAADVQPIGDLPFSLYGWDKETNEWFEVEDVVIDWKTGVVRGQTRQLTTYALLSPRLDEGQTPSFSDITGHWAERQIRQLVGEGVINGYPDGTFRPDASMTRAEFTTILVKGLGLEARRTHTFTDTQHHWAREAIETAASYGLITGYDEHTFGANDVITREQMALITLRALQMIADETVEEGSINEISFQDIDQISSWARDAVQVLQTLGIMEGYPDGSFRPQRQVTRAEAVVILIRAFY